MYFQGDTLLIAFKQKTGKREGREKNTETYWMGGRELLGLFTLNQDVICHLYMEQFFLGMKDVEMISKQIFQFLSWSVSFFNIPGLLLKGTGYSGSKGNQGGSNTQHCLYGSWRFFVTFMQYMESRMHKQSPIGSQFSHCSFSVGEIPLNYDRSLQDQRAFHLLEGIQLLQEYHMKYRKKHCQSTDTPPLEFGPTRPAKYKLKPILVVPLQYPHKKDFRRLEQLSIVLFPNLNPLFNSIDFNGN